MAKRTASAETLKPDARFHSVLAAKFINCMMWQGKKSTAERIFYDALDQIKKRMPDAEPIDVFTQAVKHVKPYRRGPLQARRRCHVSGAHAGQRNAPAKPGHSLDPRRSRGKAGRPMFLRLADEFMAAYRREGEAMTKRENTIKMAEANKAFAHFAW